MPIIPLREAMKKTSYKPYSYDAAMDVRWLVGIDGGRSDLPQINSRHWVLGRLECVCGEAGGEGI
jgi:hypothetical protein